MKPSLAILIGTLLLAFIQSATKQSATAEDKKDPTIRLGITAPFTGDFASYGELIRKGVELASADLKKEGINIELFFEDACLPTDAVSAIQKLVSIDKIHGIAANFCLIAIPPMAPTLERNKIITFHTASVSDSILDSGKFIFGTNVMVREEARKDAEYARNDLGANTASILYIETDFGVDYNKYFSSRFEELGGKIVSSDSSPMGVNDFKSLLTRIKVKNPDVLYAAHLGRTLGVLLKQKQEIALAAKVVSVYEAQDPSVLEVAKSAAEGIRFFVPEPAVETQAVRTFSDAFKKRYNEDPLILARNAYDGTRIIANALAQCKLDAECARDRVYKIANFDGASGSFSFNKEGGVERALTLMTVKDSKFEKHFD